MLNYQRNTSVLAKFDLKTAPYFQLYICLRFLVFTGI